ncbi:hypothetical protein PICSAR145_02474 [Mycobacterium avium subsp. paratuberculosis]|nr:hypothetical protein PICSAR145_02474 [Mycobacterium avium subsp. paratuberculosis]
MGASPNYTRRLRHALGVTGDTVEDIFKVLQFDVGAPPQFLDFRYSLIDPNHGEFRNDYCGALIDVEPMGDVWVTEAAGLPSDPASLCRQRGWRDPFSAKRSAPKAQTNERPHLCGQFGCRASVN